MKPRKVIVTIEMTTEDILADLRDKSSWEYLLRDGQQEITIHQVQANVVKPEKGSKRP